MKLMNNRKWVLIIGIILGLLIIGFAAAAYAPAADERDTGAGKDSAESNEPAKTAKQFTGELVCLPHKGNPEVTTLECAGGLKDEDGQYYGLTDPEQNTGNPPAYMTKATGSKVVITGVFEAGEDDVYDTIGTIRVSAVKDQE
jgi:hypothetical protein